MGNGSVEICKRGVKMASDCMQRMKYPAVFRQHAKYAVEKRKDEHVFNLSGRWGGGVLTCLATWRRLHQLRPTSNIRPAATKLSKTETGTVVPPTEGTHWGGKSVALIGWT